MLTEEALFRLGLAMTGEAEFPFFVCQEFTGFRFMGGMTFKTPSFLGRNVRLQSIGIGLSIMTGKTENRRLTLEQRLHPRGVTIMTGKAVPFSHRGMNAMLTGLLLALVVAVQADLGWRIGQHSGIFAGVFGVANLAIAILDRLMLCCRRNIVMTFQTEPALEGLHFYGRALDQVTVIAVAASYRGVNHLAKQIGITGTVLGMTIDTAGGHRITLVSFGKTGGADLVAGSTKIIGRQLQ